MFNSLPVNRYTNFAYSFGMKKAGRSITDADRADAALIPNLRAKMC